MKYFWIKEMAWLLILLTLGFYQYRVRAVDENYEQLTAEHIVMERYLEEKEKLFMQKDKKSENNNQISGQNKEIMNKEMNWKDGLYEGTGQGFGGQIKVSICIENGRIERIEVLSHDYEDDAYFSMAKELIAMQLQNQKADVDAISGATYSSNGIIEAVENALKEAES